MLSDCQHDSIGNEQFRIVLKLLAVRENEKYKLYLHLKKSHTDIFVRICKVRLRSCSVK